MSQLIALHVPNLLPNWHFFRPAGRLIWATIIFVLAIGGVRFWITRPKSPEPPTWAQSMAGAIAVFAAMLLSYGTIPHEWLTFASSYLRWDASHFIVRNAQKIGPVHWFNFDVNKQAIADTGAALIYIVMLGAQIYLWSAWQKRPVRKPDEASAEPAEAKAAGTSPYGRPMTVKG